MSKLDKTAKKYAEILKQATKKIDKKKQDEYLQQRREYELEHGRATKPGVSGALTMGLGGEEESKLSEADRLINRLRQLISKQQTKRPSEPQRNVPIGFVERERKRQEQALIEVEKLNKKLMEKLEQEKLVQEKRRLEKLLKRRELVDAGQSIPEELIEPRPIMPIYDPKERKIPGVDTFDPLEMTDEELAEAEKAMELAAMKERSGVIEENLEKQLSTQMMKEPTALDHIFQQVKEYLLKYNPKATHARVTIDDIPFAICTIYDLEKNKYDIRRIKRNETLTRGKEYDLTVPIYLAKPPQDRKNPNRTIVPLKSN